MDKLIAKRKQQHQIQIEHQDQSPPPLQQQELYKQFSGEHHTPQIQASYQPRPQYNPYEIQLSPNDSNDSPFSPGEAERINEILNVNLDHIDVDFDGELDRLDQINRDEIPIPVQPYDYNPKIKKYKYTQEEQEDYSYRENPPQKEVSYKYKEPIMSPYEYEMQETEPIRQYQQPQERKHQQQQQQSPYQPPAETNQVHPGVILRQAQSLPDPPGGKIKQNNVDQSKQYKPKPLSQEGKARQGVKMLEAEKSVDKLVKGTLQRLEEREKAREAAKQKGKVGDGNEGKGGGGPGS